MRCINTAVTLIIFASCKLFINLIGENMHNVIQAFGKNLPTILKYI